MDLISILIPAFNAKPYITETIESVLGQTDPSFEVVVVDDGSTDGTREIVREYVGRVRLLEQDNAGPAAARNLLLSEARGRYVAFLDADDRWVPDKLARQRAVFEADPDIVLAAGQLREIDADGNPLEQKEDARFRHLYDRPRHVHRELLHLGNMIPQSSVMALKACVLDVGGWFSAERILSTDYDLWIRLAERGRFYISSEVLGEYRVLERSLSHGSLDREYNGQCRILEMHRQHFTAEEFRRRLSRLYADWAESAFVRRENAWPLILQALKLNLLNLDAWRLAMKLGIASALGTLSS